MGEGQKYHAYKEIMVALRGGLNTSLDPSIIRDEQLTEASGMEYRPPRLGLFGVKGRTRADGGTILGNKVFGLSYCHFDGAASGGYLVAIASPSATAFGYIGSAESDGDIVFGVIDTTAIATATHLWASSATAFSGACHYLNDWFFYNGANRNLVLTQLEALKSSRSWQPHGLISVTATANVVATGVAGTLEAGTYDVWYTEILLPIPSAQSSYSGTPVSVTLSATGMSISVTLPATFPMTHPNTSLVEVYASVPGGSFPIGYHIGSKPAASAGSVISCVDQDFTDPYEIVAPQGGVPVSAFDEPPKAYSMRVFKDSLVMIDADDRSIIWFTLPGDPWHVPSINYIPVGESETSDDLNAIERFNDILLAFSNYYVYRVNYLPRHTDSEDITSARGMCFDVISHGHGCVSPLATAPFAVNGGSELCLFVCRDGIHITDGERISYATEDIDWEATVSIANLSRCVLKNNPKRHRIEFYYVDATDTSLIKRLDLYYHPSLMTQGPMGFPRLPVLGPTRVPGLSPALGTFNSDWQMWCGSETVPRVFIEGTGTEDGADLENADGRITHAWRTKNFYMAGLHGEYELYKVYTHQGQTTASGTYTITAEGRTDDEGTTFIATSTVNQSLHGAQPHPGLHQRAQRFSLRGEKTDGGAWQELNYIVFVVKGAHELHSAKSS